MKLRYFRRNNAVPAEVAMAEARADEDDLQAFMRLKEEAYQVFLAELRELGAVHPVFDDIEDGVYEGSEGYSKSYLYGWFYIPDAPKEA